MSIEITPQRTQLGYDNVRNGIREVRNTIVKTFDPNLKIEDFEIIGYWAGARNVRSPKIEWEHFDFIAEICSSIGRDGREVHHFTASRDGDIKGVNAVRK